MAAANGEPASADVDQEDDYMVCALCITPYLAATCRTLPCGHNYCAPCVIQMTDEQCHIKCSICPTGSTALPRRIRKICEPPPAAGNHATAAAGNLAAAAVPAGACCQLVAPQRVVITPVTSRPPLTDAQQQRRRDNNAAVRVCTGVCMFGYPFKARTHNDDT